MDIAIQFNNSAVELLNEQCCHDAFNMFQRSMSVLSQLSAQHSAHQPLHVTEDLECIQQAQTTLLETTRNGKRSRNNITPFFYSKPISITSTYYDEIFRQGNYGERTEVLQRCTSIVMFNFALTHHLKFFDGPSTQEVLLHRALKLYRMCFNLIIENVSNGGEEQSVDYALAIATLNNKAQIYHEIGNYTESEFHLEQMREIVMSLDETVHPLYLLEDGDTFLLNATLLREPTNAGAA